MFFQRLCCFYPPQPYEDCKVLLYHVKSLEKALVPAVEPCVELALDSLEPILEAAVQPAVEPAAGWSEVFTLCLNNCHFSELDVVRLSSTSNAVRCFVVEQLSSGDRTIARMLLQREVPCASTVTPDIYQRHMKAVSYLLRVADIPTSLMQLDSRDLVMNSQVPLQLKMLLTAAGVTPTYEQVVTAAEQGVKGCEEWIVAHCATCRQRGEPTGISDIVEAVCTGTKVATQLSNDVTSDSLADLLHIALNARSSKHMFTFSSLCQGKAAEQLMPAAVAEILTAAIHLLCDTDTDYSVVAQYLKSLANSQEAQRVSPSEAFSIIQSTIQTMSKVHCKDPYQRRLAGFCTEIGCYSLPAAQQLCAAEICSLLCLALRKVKTAAKAQRGSADTSSSAGLLEDCLGQLLRLPAAKWMDKAAVDSLLVEATEWEVYHGEAARHFMQELSSLRLAPKAAV